MLRYDDAIAVYENLLKNQNSEKTIFLKLKLANAYYLNNNIKLALDAYNEVYKNDKKTMSAAELYKYGQTLLNEGKIQKGSRILKKSKNITFKNRKKKAITENKKLNASLKVMDSAIVTVLNMDFNTVNADFSPSHYKKNQLIFSTAQQKTSYQDLYIADLTKELLNTYNPYKLRDSSINTEDHETAAVVSLDSKTLYFTRGCPVKNFNTCDRILKIYSAKFINGAWFEPTPVSFSSDTYSTAHPNLSTDGKKMFFASNMSGTLGGADIFVVTILDDGSFSSPKNLGNLVNTEGDELFPYSTEESLFFSSNGHDGFGRLDIYEASFSSDKGFYNVAHLPAPYNSASDDFSFIKNVSSKSGYFASDREGGKGSDDIYYFQER